MYFYWSFKESSNIIRFFHLWQLSLFRIRPGYNTVCVITSQHLYMREWKNYHSALQEKQMIIYQEDWNTIYGLNSGPFFSGVYARLVASVIAAFRGWFYMEIHVEDSGRWVIVKLTTVLFVYHLKIFCMILLNVLV